MATPAPCRALWTPWRSLSEDFCHEEGEGGGEKGRRCDTTGDTNYVASQEDLFGTPQESSQSHQESIDEPADEGERSNFWCGGLERCLLYTRRMPDLGEEKEEG